MIFRGRTIRFRRKNWGFQSHPKSSLTLKASFREDCALTTQVRQFAILPCYSACRVVNIGTFSFYVTTPADPESSKICPLPFKVTPIYGSCRCWVCEWKNNECNHLCIMKSHQEPCVADLYNPWIIVNIKDYKTKMQCLYSNFCKPNIEDTLTPLWKNIFYIFPLSLIRLLLKLKTSHPILHFVIF